jgi:hypothetical protein
VLTLLSAFPFKFLPTVGIQPGFASRARWGSRTDGVGGPGQPRMTWLDCLQVAAYWSPTWSNDKHATSQLKVANWWDHAARASDPSFSVMARSSSGSGSPYTGAAQLVDQVLPAGASMKRTGPHGSSWREGGTTIAA